MFAAYPTSRAAEGRRLCAVATGDRPGPIETFGLRRYDIRRRLLDDPARIEAILKAFAAAGPTGATEAEVAAAIRYPVASVGRAALWLLKYNFLVEIP
jgi:hypothetical protein